MTTIRRTRSQVTDEVMVVALSVGACPGGALAALKGLLEQFDETLSKRVFTTKKGSDDPFSATSRRSPTVRERVQKSAVLRYVWELSLALQPTCTRGAHSPLLALPLPFHGLTSDLGQ
jgi:hypothetical protein